MWTRSTCSSPHANNWLNKVWALGFVSNFFFFQCRSYKSRHVRAMDLMCSPRLLHLCIGMTSAVLPRGCIKGKKEGEKGRAVERKLGCLCCSPNTSGRRDDGELSRHGVWRRGASSAWVLTRLAQISKSGGSCLVFLASSESSACLGSPGARLFGRGVNRCPLRNFARLFLNHTWKTAFRYLHLRF